MSATGNQQNRQAPPRLRLRVRSAAESILRSGHPWLFADSIKEQNRPGQLGELAVIYDRSDKFLAAGLFDPDSPIRVRILHTGKPQSIDAAWWRKHLEDALKRREVLLDSQTTGWRCINGEGDGWPGLVLDRYGETLVLKLYTAAWLPRLAQLVELFSARKPTLSAIRSHRLQSDLRGAGGEEGDDEPAEKMPLEGSREDTLSAACGGEGRGEVVSSFLFPLHSLVLRLSRNIQSIAKSQFDAVDGSMLLGKPPAGPVTFLETGLRFEADVLRGQKTGFFLDQRENRRLVEPLSSGRAVLNAFSFSGGFSLYAARGGAQSVTDLDISEHALAAARRNFALNQSIPAVARCRHHTAQADTFEWLEQQPPARFDLVILDPPSLAKRESERAGAIRAYGRLASLGIRALKPNGILLAASCSAHVTAEEFFQAVRQSAAISRRKFTELQTTGHAPDHPARIKEMEYLKAIYLKFD